MQDKINQTIIEVKKLGMANAADIINAIKKAKNDNELKSILAKYGISLGIAL
jgi:hypothetical protein